MSPIRSGLPAARDDDARTKASTGSTRSNRSRRDGRSRREPDATADEPQSHAAGVLAGPRGCLRLDVLARDRRARGAGAAGGERTASAIGSGGFTRVAAAVIVLLILGESVAVAHRHRMEPRPGGVRYQGRATRDGAAVGVVAAADARLRAPARHRGALHRLAVAAVGFPPPDIRRSVAAHRGSAGGSARSATCAGSRRRCSRPPSWCRAAFVALNYLVVYRHERAVDQARSADRGAGTADRRTDAELQHRHLEGRLRPCPVAGHGQLPLQIWSPSSRPCRRRARRPTSTGR